MLANPGGEVNGKETEEVTRDPSVGDGTGE